MNALLIKGADTFMQANFTTLADVVIVQYASLLNDWLPKDATIAIAVEDTYIYYKPKQIDIQLSVGQTVDPISIANLVYSCGEKVQQTIQHSLTGDHYDGIGYPITIHGKKGVIVIILPPTKALPKKTLRFITGRNEDEWQPIPIEEISFFESLNKKNWCYEHKNSYQISLTMKELASRLPENFIRIHRSYIINIRNIAKITRDFASNLLIVMKSGEQLPVSQSYVSELRKALEF